MKPLPHMAYAAYLTYNYETPLKVRRVAYAISNCVRL